MRSFLALFIFSIASLHAEEGMWTFNNFPGEKVRQKYGFAPTQQWLDQVRLSSVRLAEGCSASFVSPGGLVLTNHHCAATCIQELSTAEKDYAAKGFLAPAESGELRCPSQEANVLTEIVDVTPRIAGVTKGLASKAANEARKAETSRIEKECATTESLRCEVVSLYGGGVYNLYKYQRYQDVRLVFAPEQAIAFFGGDPDNFNFPRFNLDMSLLRVYEKGAPIKTPHHLKWSASGPKQDELTFVSGHPGGTNRKNTIAMLELERDLMKPTTLFYLAEYRGMLTAFQTRGDEQRRISQDELLGVENSFKAFKGQHQALLEAKFFDQKKAEESDFQKRVNADPKLKAEYSGVWKDIAGAVQRQRELYIPYLYFERGYAFRSDLYRHARRLVRAAEEFPKPNDKRLPEYTDARKPEIRQATLSAAPIYPEFEIETLTFSLTKLREALGPDDPAIRELFGKMSPRDLATETVKRTTLMDVAARKALLEGGQTAVSTSPDPMIALAKLVNPIASKIRKQMEDEVESTLIGGLEKLAKARFAVYGTSIYPDATFTLRLSYGSVKGWQENGKTVPPFTILGGAFERATGRDPFALPQSWLEAKPKLDLQTRFNFVSTNDIIGGNSGSPIINKDAELVGLIFDGNIHSLGGNYGFDESLNRAVSVHSSAILQALEKIYGARRILGELKAK
jgi:hypothetical protein